MPAVEPSLMALPSPLIAENPEAFDHLVTFLDFAERFQLGFVELNFDGDGDTLLETLRRHPACQMIQFTVLRYAQPDLRFVLDRSRFVFCGF